jgi:hypothetical protein
MILKALEDRVKTFIVKQEIEGQVHEVPVDKVVGQNISLIEVEEVYMFKQLINPRTNKPFKGRCLLRTMDGWMIVKHSFEELQKIKQNLHKKIEIKGFRK